MELTEEEFEWAIRIKEIMMSDPELSNNASVPPLRDMMIAQIALVSITDAELGPQHDDDIDGNDMVEEVKERIRGIQRVQHAFEITESLEEAKSLHLALETRFHNEQNFTLGDDNNNSNNEEVVEEDTS